MDGDIEALERKADILAVAQQAKQAQAYLGYQQLAKERDALRYNLDQTEIEFKAQQRRFAQENGILERQTGK